MTNKPQFVGERVKLGDVVAAVPGRNADLHCNAVYSVTNSQGFVPSEEYFSKDVFSKDLKSYRVVKRNMIAYNPSRINVGSVALQDKEDEVVVSPLYVIFSTDERKVLPDYVVRFLKSKPGLDQIAFRSIGTVRNNLKFKALCQMTIKLPSLGEQQSRLSNLRSIQNQIDRANRQLAALDSLVKSRFVEMFGRLDANPKEFKVVSFSDLGSWTSGGTPSRKNPDYFEGDIDWYSAGELDSLYLKNSKEKITALAIEESSAKLFAAGSLLVGMYDTAALKLGIATKQCSSNQACANLEPNEAVNLVWLYFAIVQLKPMLLSERSGCRQKNLSLRKIKSFELPLPPLPLQQEFADFVAQVDKSRFIAQQQIEKLQMLYDSLAQEYFE